MSSVITQRVAGLEDEMPDYRDQYEAHRAYDNAYPYDDADADRAHGEAQADALGAR